MASEEYDKLVVLEVPIYHIEFLGGYLLVAGAGGGKKYGVRNYFMSFKIKNSLISKEPSNKIEFSTEIPYYIKAVPLNLTCILCLNDYINVYSLDNNNGNLTQISTIKILDYSTPDIYLSVFSLDFDINNPSYKNNKNKIELAASGNTEGLIK